MNIFEIIIAAVILGLALYLFIRSLRSKSKGDCSSCAGCASKCPDEKENNFLLLKK